MEKLLIEACLELIQEDLVAGMQDLGAAGLTSSIAETASKKGLGVMVDVSKVPRREEGMTPYEIMLSESQERMLIVPRSGKEDRIAEIFDKWGLDAVVIGKVTGDGLFKVYEGEVLVGEVPVAALTEGCPVYVRQGIEPPYYKELQAYDINTLPGYDPQEALLKLLASPNIASKKWVYRQYDYQVMTNTAIVPGDGDAAVLRIKDTIKGVALTTDCNSRMVYLDPYRGGKLAVCEAARNLACCGARPLALTNCLNFGNPEKPYIYWQMQNAIRGMADAARALNTPVVSGNVSLYNESKSVGVLPTPVVGMVGLLQDISQRCTMSFKDEGDIIVLLGRVRTELGGSEYLAVCHGIEAGEVPDPDLQEEIQLIELLLELCRRRLIKSAHDISEGGLAVTLAESAIKGRLGFTVDLPGTSDQAAQILFSEAPTRVAVSLAAKNLDTVKSIASQYQLPLTVLGRVGGRRLVIGRSDHMLIDLDLEQAAHTWGEVLACIMK